MKKGINKYYTPTIEEFHVGFEYEMKENFMDGTVKTQEQYDKAMWEKITVTPGESAYIERALYGRNHENSLCGLRVKYLNKEDIESLGFEFKGDDRDGQNLYYYHKIVERNLWVLYDYRYNFGDKNDEGEESIRIFKANPKYGDHTFHGRIKNKSELKVLLKQLNIL